jgi:sugar phosphate isomerase/epimerase
VNHVALPFSRLGIDAQTVLGMPPIEHASLAADLGCSHISTGLTALPWKLQRFPAWSLRDDPQLRRELIAVLRDRRITISQAEGFSVRPTTNVQDYLRDLDLFAELGAQRASGVCTEPNVTRARDLLATLADEAAARGMGFSLEFAPPHAIGDLKTARAALEALGKPNVGVVIDAMHFFRSGGSIAELRAFPAELLAYVQLCDAPERAPHNDYLREACFERRALGEGELPLTEFCAALPRNVQVGIEIPLLERAGAAAQHQAFVTRSTELAHQLLRHC